MDVEIKGPLTRCFSCDYLNYTVAIVNLWREDRNF